ncbi:hypothetical protein LTR36_004911 [Oleoguttula mirabilis]|uniref:Disease resistance R13L4/SHOC-2-like LRR domain-containing protein n=1 Tax=Oleoguttula mirabilis TaxID=1507867 RepID=A0AAV9JY90_9PEZI|nr:hypothetical protein LTR36_004911 [Oleoguttula mirabilis]
MATDATATYGDKPSMTVAHLVAFTKKELDADAERQSKVSATGIDGLDSQSQSQSQTGATLDLSHKNIQALPVEVIVLIKDRVERLALSHNPQIAVPSQIVQCDRLRYLNIRWNQLKHFPTAVLQLSSLEILDISKNRIISIPEEIKSMTSLKFLAIARNKVTRLPLALGEMASLSKLKFDENPIEFPPPEALKLVQNHVSSTIESEKDVCQQVKRFLKAAALRERLRTRSEEDLSESNVETPRPPKRTMTTGRFPIRPSISGIDHADDLRLRSPNAPPPIPQRSHARNLSSNAPVVRRPGIAPLMTDGDDISRSRSETVSSSSSIRSRRQGFVPSKTRIDLSTVSELGGASSVRLSQATTIRPSHTRGNSSVSTLNGYLTAGSGGETSSGAVSPIDGPTSRYGPIRRLSSLPENRNSKVQTSDAIRAAKRLLFSLFQLHGPMGEVTRALNNGTPRRSTLERQLFSANAHVEELDRLLSKLDSSRDDNGKNEKQALKSIVLTSVAAMKAYGYVIKELRHSSQKAVSLTDAVYVRCLMSQIYMTMVESRNICTILGFKIKSPPPRSTLRVSRAWSSRTVTPTQAKPVNNRRLRGATILQSMTSNGTLRAVPPPVPLNGHGSRTNTMTSLSAVTPRSGDSFSTMSTSNLPSRSNTMRSVIDDGEYDDNFDRIYAKLKSACDLAAQSLPHCRTEFFGGKNNADQVSQTRAAHHWALAINKCDTVIAANNMLISRLRVIRVKDPMVRNQRDFWQLCDAFVQSWTDLATEIKDISQQRIDITTVKTVMRPVQKAVKEVSKTISESPLYHQAVRPAMAQAPHNLPPPYPSNINTAFAQAAGQRNGLHSGYVTPVPATPLSAALGPAVQATVASMPHTSNVAPEYYPHSAQPAPLNFAARAVYERFDTMGQYPGQGRR